VRETFADYAAAWRRKPWLPLIGVLGVLFVLVSIAATFSKGLGVILFIPGLIFIYLHHLLVQRTLDG
jgi:hypothetical protein